jgi:hypothetical protein
MSINKFMILYTFGDSFTYGEELSDPQTQAWPALVAKNINSELKNYSLPGCGNEYIVKRVMRKVAAIDNDQQQLFLIAWTSCGRLEFADEFGAYDIWAGCRRRWKDPQPHREMLIKYITAYNNVQHQYRTWLRQCVLLQDFLKVRNINYKFITAFDNHILNQQFLETAEPYNRLLDTSNFIGWPNTSLMELMGDCEKGPRGHPLIDGHKQIAKAITSSLQDYR